VRRRSSVPALVAMILIALITWALFQVATEENPVPAIRYLYFIPVLLISFYYGLSMGLLATFAVASIMLPRLLLIAKVHFFSEKVSSIVAELLLLALGAIAIDQWFGSQQRQRDFYRTLSDLGELFASRADPDAILRMMLEESARIFGATWGEIIIKVNGRLRRKVRLGEGGNAPSEIPLPPEGRKTLAEKIIDEGRSYLINNLEIDVRFSRWFKDGPRINSFMAVPIRRRGEPFGLIALGNKFDGPFTKDELAMLEAIVAKSEAALENAILLAEERKRTLRLAVLNEIAQAISSVMDTEELFKIVHKEMGRLVDVTNFYIALYNPEREEIEFAFAVEDGKMLDKARLERATRKMRPSGLTEYIIRTGKPLFLPSRLEEELERLGIQPIGRLARSWMGVPMIAHGKVIGVMAVQDYERENAYTRDDLETLQNIANQTAIALENARLLEKTDEALAQRVRELTTLREIDRELAMACLDLTRVLNLVLERAIAATGAAAGALALLEEREAGKGLYVLAQKGYPEEFKYYMNHPYPVTKGITGRVARTGEPCLCPNVEEDPDYEMTLESTKAQLSVPILLEGKVIGTLTLESPYEGAFTEGDLSFIQQLADRAAIAIQHARLYEEIQKASEAKSEFVSIVSHELRNPMTNIKGYTDLILSGKAGPISERQREFLGKVRSNVQRMSNLVEDLLNISLIEAGKLRLRVEPVYFPGVIEEVMSSVRRYAEEKKLILEVEINDAIPPVRADRSRVVQILSNLVNNACAYTPSEGKVKIRVKQVNGYVEVDVEDTGIGIPDDEQEKIFERFFRGSHPMVKETGGTGLGLYITKNLVEMQGGKIWFKSKVGEGSVFSFTLPIWTEGR